MKKTILIIALLALAATTVLAADTPQVKSETKVTIASDTPDVGDGTGVKTKLEEGSEYKYNYRRNHSYSYRHNNSGENSNCQYGKSRQSNRKK